MFFKLGLFIASLLTLVTTPCFSQQEIGNMEEMLIEQLTDITDDEIDVSEVIDKLLDYQKKPLNLNTANEKELSDLIFLSPQQIQSILDHRTLTGEFLSILELQSIRDLDLRTIQLLKLFVEVSPPAIWKELDTEKAWKGADQTMLLRYGRILERQDGYGIKEGTRSRYLGDPNRYFMRYKLSYEDKIQLSLNMEKDAGEPFFKKKQSFGFDFYSGSLAFFQVSRSVKQIVIGDYALQFGQGLILWNGLSFGKGAWIGGVAKQGRGLQPYSSMNENFLQRGIAGTFAFGQFEITPFISYKRLSGNVEQHPEGEQVIASINYSGLHRTPTEQSYRKAIGQFNYGTHLSYHRSRFVFGLTYLSTSFSHKVVRGSDLYQRFDFKGKSIQQIGMHYSYTYKNLYFFGEAAKSLEGGIALINGVLASVHPKLSVIVSYRNYQRNYHQFYAKSLGEGSKVTNEKGVYSGLVYHPNRKIEWAIYMDSFSFPWLRYRVDAPSRGIDFLSQWTYSWYKKGTVKLRYRHRVRQENTLPLDRHENLLANVLHEQLRAEFQYKLTDNWRIKSRAEWIGYEKERNEPRQGWLIYHDVFWKGYKSRLQMNVRLAFFNTQGYDARIYAYESNVLYASGFPMYYDKGVRTYLNIRWRAARKIDLWVRYGCTKYIDKKSIGSGLDEIIGNTKSDLTMQLRWQW